jgi:four helix bundle protein
MNDPEVTMHDTRNGNELIAHRKAVEAAGIAISLISRLPPHVRSLADQVVRSASSVAANLAEGQGRFGKDRAYHWRVAYGSAREVDTHLRLLVGAGAVDPIRAEEACRLFDEVRAMTWRLLHPRSRT